jgi:hypothetical protein
MRLFILYVWVILLTVYTVRDNIQTFEWLEQMATQMVESHKTIHKELNK